ncbi:DUF308 domain-containing protein [Rhodopseudomonas sp. BR0M22]|nr:DUF308 domain-containing protein [Rhodopseudomonas sp. BR0M22]NEW91291.1 DUF308 domain-containing protein [Rhodopseudomonas sp. BR0M22]
MVLLLVAGIVFLLAGAASIVVGVPVKEFSFGNTLILSGVVGACTGALLLGLSAVIRELRLIGSGLAADESEPSVARAPTRATLSSLPVDTDSDTLFPGERPEPSLPPAQPLPAAAEPAGAAPWQQEASARDRLRQRAAPPLEIKPPPPPPGDSARRAALEAEEDETSPPKRRNLLFASSRRERERAAQTGGDASTGDLLGGAATSFHESWSQMRTDADSNEAAPAQERSGLLEPTPAPRSEEMQQVTVLKSGVVDGMAYSLYSDGSIEAQMPEGMMRFESIDELRDHLEQRG